MVKIIAIANQKGGVGKTTTCVNLAASLAHYQRRVLLLDLDPQGNATMGCGIDKHAVALTLNELLLDEAAISNVLCHSEAGFDVIPANSDLTIAEVSLLQADDREHCLQKCLASVQDQYDYILIDCPPSLNMLTVNALVAADGVLIPMQCEYYALEGLTGLLNTIHSIKQTANPKLHVDGLVRTLFDGRNSLANQVAEQLLNFNERVYQTVIPRNVRLAEAPSHGLVALQYDKSSAGAAAYLALAREVLYYHEGVEVSTAEISDGLLKQRVELPVQE